jgi:uncharacterized protein (TIGR02270 family)
MARPIKQLVYHHAETTSFLWLKRTSVLQGPHYNFTDLERLDHRLLAQLRALTLDLELAGKMTRRNLKAHQEPGEIFASAYVALLQGNQARIAKVLAAVGENAANIAAFAGAMVWLPDLARSRDYALQFLLSDEPISRRIGLAALTIFRQLQESQVARNLNSSDHALVARVARAIGEMGFVKEAATLKPLLAHSDLSVRFWAAWSLALLTNDPKALAELRTIVLTEKSYRWRGVDLLGRCGDVRGSAKWLLTLEGNPEGTRLVLQGLKAIGDPEAIPRLLDEMKEPARARVAGEAFAHITGVHLTSDKLETTSPEGYKSGPTEDPADEEVALDPDDNLAWPDRVKCADWWAKNRSKFTPGTRYLDGKPINAVTLREILKSGYQRQRAAAALELAMLEPGKPLFEARAPSFHQSL